MIPSLRQGSVSLWVAEADAPGRRASGGPLDPLRDTIGVLDLAKCTPPDSPRTGSAADDCWADCERPDGPRRSE